MFIPIFPDSSVGRAARCKLLQLIVERRFEKRGELLETQTNHVAGNQQPRSDTHRIRFRDYPFQEYPEFGGSASRLTSSYEEYGDDIVHALQ